MAKLDLSLHDQYFVAIAININLLFLSFLPFSFFFEKKKNDLFPVHFGISWKLIVIGNSPKSQIKSYWTQSLNMKIPRSRFYTPSLFCEMKNI
jgi:hypothetical protein